MYTALSAGCLSHPKGHGQYDTALTALEKCQKSQESPLYNPGLPPEKTGMSLESQLALAHDTFHGVKRSYKKLKKGQKKNKNF